jgi:hypothetical protein
MLTSPSPPPSPPRLAPPPPSPAPPLPPAGGYTTVASTSTSFWYAGAFFLDPALYVVINATTNQVADRRGTIWTRLDSYWSYYGVSSTGPRALYPSGVSTTNLGSVFNTAASSVVKQCQNYAASLGYDHVFVDEFRRRPSCNEQPAVAWLLGVRLLEHHLRLLFRRRRAYPGHMRAGHRQRPLTDYHYAAQRHALRPPRLPVVLEGRAAAEGAAGVPPHADRHLRCGHHPRVRGRRRLADGSRTPSLTQPVTSVQPTTPDTLPATHPLPARTLVNL